MANLKINLEEIKGKLYEKLKPSGWGDPLKTFIMSADMDKILQALMKDAQDGKRFTPVLKQVFRAFEECPYNQLKVVMIGKDPYPYAPKEEGQLPIADGIAFSCSNSNKIETALKFIYMEVNDTVYPGQEYIWEPDLKHWSNQGMLIINSSFTTNLSEVGKHEEIWKPFMAFLLDTLSFHNHGLIYVFMGRKAQEWDDSVPDNANWKLFCSHPATAAYEKKEHWDSGNIFTKVSHLVFDNYKYKIKW